MFRCFVSTVSSMRACGCNVVPVVGVSKDFLFGCWISSGLRYGGYAAFRTRATATAVRVSVYWSRVCGTHALGGMSRRLEFSVSIRQT